LYMVFTYDAYVLWLRIVVVGGNQATLNFAVLSMSRMRPVYLSLVVL
jgi:hypothetical protein